MNELEEFALKAIAESKANGTWVEEPTEVVTETKTETKAEVKEEVKVEVTPTENVEVKTEVTEPKSVIDVISSLNKVTEPAKEIELPEEIKARLALADKYEQFSKSELAQLLETDLTPLDLLSSIEVVDYSKMSVEQLITENAKLIAGDRFKEEMVEEAIEAYNNLPTTLDKIEYEKKLVEKLGNNKIDYKNELVKKIQDYQSSKKATQAPIDINKIAEAELSKVDTALNELVTKHGLDKEIAEGIKKTYNVNLAGAFVDEKQNFNELEFIKAAYKMVAYDKDIEKLKNDFATQVLEAEKRAYEKAKKEFGGADLTTSGLTPEALSFEEIYRNAVKNA